METNFQARLDLGYEDDNFNLSERKFNKVDARPVLEQRNNFINFRIIISAEHFSVFETKLKTVKLKCFNNLAKLSKL